MTRAFDADQSPLWVRSELVRIDLIHLITYSDRDAETGLTHYYFARSNVLFNFDEDGEVEFQPLLQSIGPLSASINHLPSPNDSGLLRKPLEITLSNAPYGASAARLIATLRAGDAIENARIEWTQIALADRPTTVRIDLSALVGDEHTFWYRGRVRRVGPISNTSIVLSCEMEMPELAWARSTDVTKTEPDHVGVRWPKITGEAKRVACINHDVGFLSTNVDADDGTGTSVPLTDATGFGSTGRATWGGEVITWSGKTGDTLTGVARGVDGSPACNHPAGDLVVEAIEGALFGVADHAVSAINDVYALNPYSGHVVKLGTAFTKNITDTVDGDTRASLEFTQAELDAALRALAASPEVTDDGTLPTNPAYEQRPMTDYVHSNGYYASRMAVADGIDGIEQEHGLNEEEFLRLKFFRPSAGYGRQQIKISIDLDAGSGSVSCYAGYWYLAGTPVPPLIDTETLISGPNTYTFDTLLDSEWVSFYFTGTGLTANIREVWQLVDNPLTETPQSATNGKEEFLAEVSSGNWFDDNDSTSENVGTDDWIGCKFAAGTFDVQRIKIRCSQPDHEFNMYVGNTYGATNKIWSPAEYHPTVGSNPTTYYFETDQQGRYVTFQNEDSTLSVEVYEISRELLVYAAPPEPAITIAGASVGYGLRLFADVDGYVSPTTTPDYKCGDAALIKKPCDLLRYIIEVLGGESIDTTTYDTCYTNLGGAAGVEIACDLRTMGGLTWEEVAQRVAFESRVTLVPEETAAGRVWKMMTALSTYAFTAASGSISEWARGSFTEVGRALRDELATRFLFPYAPDWSRGDGEEAYTAALVANEDSNDLTVPSTANLIAAVALYGNINADPIAFRALRDAVSAKDVAGYYAHELIRGGALFAIKDVPWWEAYAVEVGDIVNATPPWESAAVKCRVIEYTKDPSTELIELRLVEVE